MENLNQRENHLFYCENYINIRKFLERGETAKNTSFLEKYPADEIITNIGETELSPLMVKNQEKRCCLDVAGCLTIEEINTFEHRSLTNGVSINVGTTVIWHFMWFSNRLYQHKPETGRLFYY
jgi:hypothetical protein